jgi:hypothetical protein
MPVDEPGRHRAAGQLDDARLRPDVDAHGLVVADREHAVAAHRERAHPRLGRVVGDDVAADEHEAREFRRPGRRRTAASGDHERASQ